jgi:hypothetical protein
MKKILQVRIESHHFRNRDIIGGDAALDFVNTVTGRDQSPRDWLDSYPRLLEETQLHWAIFIGPLVLFIVAVCLFSVGGNAPIIAVLLLLFGAIPTAIDAAVTRATSEFVVTNKRVLIKTGWIRRHSLETLLSKVEGIRVEQDILGRMFDYGTIVVTGTGGSKEQFHKISDPMLFRRRIQDEIAAGEGAPTYRKRLVD